jgi:hypothetical protein
MLNAPRRWWDAAALLTRGFESLAATRQDDAGGPTWRRVEAQVESPAPTASGTILPL